jgi:tetratricopeptide (TPR) repeat protein
MRVISVLLILMLAACAVSSAERNNAGNAALTAGDVQAALRGYQSAQALAPDQAEPYLNAASAYAMLDDDRRAQAAMQQALTSPDPRLIAHAYFNLGNIYFMRGQYDLAISAYRETLLRTPDDADARYNLELALQRAVPTLTPPATATPTPEPPADDPSATATPPPTPESDSQTLPQNTQPMTEAEAQALLDSLDPNFRPLNLTGTPSTGDVEEQDW